MLGHYPESILFLLFEYCRTAAGTNSISPDWGASTVLSGGLRKAGF